MKMAPVDCCFCMSSNGVLPHDREEKNHMQVFMMIGHGRFATSNIVHQHPIINNNYYSNNNNNPARGSI